MYEINRSDKHICSIANGNGNFLIGLCLAHECLSNSGDDSESKSQAIDYFVSLNRVSGGDAQEQQEFAYKSFNLGANSL